MALPLPALLLLALSVAIGIIAPSPVRSESAGEREALLGFINALPHAQRVRWYANSSACSWVGVTCDTKRSTVKALRLPGVGLVGAIPVGTLGRLSSLRVLSLRSNRLYGPIPDDLAGLTLLHSLYLEHNLFSGEIPSGLSQLNRLLRLDLSANNLTGEIPFALSNLTHLKRLFLQENRLSGSLPNIDIDSLVDFNVSNNRLSGSIPRALQRFSASSFVRNLDLCGSPLPPCSPFSPSPVPSPAAPSEAKSRKLSMAAIVGISVAAGIGLLLLFLLVVLIGWTARWQRQRGPGGKAGAAATTDVAGKSGETVTSSSKDDIRGGVGSSGALADAVGRNRLVFVGKRGGYSFDLEDLLRASAEVLGKGSVGTSYKAVMEEGTTVVVKRLKDVAAAKREFEEHMEALGQIEPMDNLLPIRAYYYSNDEKLLVSDYLPAGSLSSLLHGSRGSGLTPLDWESRIRVALAAGRGLYHLHTAAQIVHGNVKASNVLLRSNHDSAVLSDFGLHPLFGSSAPANGFTGYRAPEVLETRKPTFKSDVYSFGVLLLELLTGKAPNQASLGEDGIDLPRWVQSVVREEWTAEVFDVELMRYPDIEEELVQLLQVAMVCVSTVPDARPDIPEVVRMMEEIVNLIEATGVGRQAGGSAALSLPPVSTP